MIDRTITPFQMQLMVDSELGNNTLIWIPGQRFAAANLFLIPLREAAWPERDKPMIMRVGELMIKSWLQEPDPDEVMDWYEWAVEITGVATNGVGLFMAKVNYPEDPIGALLSPSWGERGPAREWSRGDPLSGSRLTR